MMQLFTHQDFDDHETVSFYHDKHTGLKAIIAIHSTKNGPALGGCRMWPYATEEQALADVLRLSQGMTYKCAAAGLSLGGGKSVIIGDPKRDKTPQLLHSMAEFLNRLNGTYIAAEDSGTSVADLQTIGQMSAFVAGVNERLDVDGKPRDGDPSPSTALGTYIGIQAAARFRLDRTNLQGLKVNIQGLGNVGLRLAEYLARAGATLNVYDIDPVKMEKAVSEYGAKAHTAESIISTPADVFAPCALGGAINDHSLDRLDVSIVAGAANNQLARPEHGDQLRQKRIVYAPDFVINAGGIIDVAMDKQGASAGAIQSQIEAIGPRLMELFILAEKESIDTASLAIKQVKASL